MATPAKVPTPEEKAFLLQAVSQLDMLLMAFESAPAKVKIAAKEFREALSEWAESK